MVVIRPARLSDADGIVAVDEETWSTLSSPAPRPTQPRAFDGVDPADVIVAVDHTGALLGYIQIHNAIRLPSHAHVIEINGLAVLPSATGQGLGARLVHAAVDEAIRRGAAKVTLRVLAPNERARALYERCGFAVEGVLRAEFLIAGKYVDDVLMARFVDAAPFRTR